MTLELRDLARSDREMIRTWRNLPEIARYMYSDHMIGDDEHARWFEAATQDPARRYWIVEADGEDVGLANVYDIDLRHSRAAWAFYLASPNVRGKGVGSYVEYRMLSYVFEERRLHRLTCEVLAFNEAVVSMHEGFGFKREGILRQHILKDGEFVDVIQLGMLDSEWRQARPTIEQRLREKGVVL